MSIVFKLLLIIFTSLSTSTATHSEATSLPETTQVEISVSKEMEGLMTQQVDMLSKTIQSAKSTKEVEAILVKAFNEKALKYEYLYYGNVKGEFVVAPKIELPPDYDCRQRPYYLDAVKHDYYFSEIYVDEVSGKHILTLSKAVYSKGKLIGVLGIDVNLD